MEGTIVHNGTMELQWVDSYRHGERSAVICKLKDGCLIVGKNYELDLATNQLSWSWGSYDIETEQQARKIALAWIF